MKKNKKDTKDTDTITAILLGENGFSRRMKISAKDVPNKINLPFLYRLRITSAVVADHFDVEIPPVGEFSIQKRTKTTATYRLVNMYQARPTP